VIPPDPLANARFTRLTDWEGTEGAAAISPDGKFVAFLADRDGRFGLWVSQVGTGRFVNLTANLGSLSSPSGPIRRLGFFGDGADIWFTAGGRPMAMPLTGGTPRVFLGEGAASPAWSPDGTRLVYFVNRSGDPLFVADHLGTDAKPINAPGKLFESGLHNHSPVWSLDNQWIYFVHGLDPSREVDVWRVRPSGESPEPLTDRSVGANFLTPIDPQTLLYTARAADRSGPWLWAMDVDSKTSRRLSHGLEQYTSLSASQDGRRVVATVSSPTANLWRVPIGNRVADDRDVSAVSIADGACVQASSGKVICSLSAGGTGDGLWRVGMVRQSIDTGAGAGLSNLLLSRKMERRRRHASRTGRQQLTVMSWTARAHAQWRRRLRNGTAAWSPDRLDRDWRQRCPGSRVVQDSCGRWRADPNRQR
jgi:Tol biopolymer transport system component